VLSDIPAKSARKPRQKKKGSSFFPGRSEPSAGAEKGGRVSPGPPFLEKGGGRGERNISDSLLSRYLLQDG